MTTRSAAAIIGACFLAAHAANATPVYWSNGDVTANFQSLGFNEIEILPQTDQRFFEDFTVNDPFGITITGLWSENLIPRGTAGSYPNAQWLIGSPTTAAIDGTPIITGQSSTTRTLNGTSVTLFVGQQSQIFDGYQFLVTGLNIHLDPGSYSFAVTPVVQTDVACFGGTAGCAPLVQLANGVNAAGTPTGNNNGIERRLQFVKGPPVVHLSDTGNNLAMGILADVTAAPTTPEPAGLALLGIGGVLALVFGRRLFNVVND